MLLFLSQDVILENPEVLIDLVEVVDFNLKVVVHNVLLTGVFTLLNFKVCHVSSQEAKAIAFPCTFKCFTSETWLTVVSSFAIENLNVVLEWCLTYLMRCSRIIIEKALTRLLANCIQGWFRLTRCKDLAAFDFELETALSLLML